MKLPRLRFTVRRLMIAVALVALAIGGYLWMVLPPYERVELAPQPLSASTDYDIFDVVLLDLLFNKEFDPMAGDPGPAKPNILLGMMTARGGSYASPQLVSWVRENETSSEIIDDLKARNPKGILFSLAQYCPSDPKILVQNVSRADLERDFKLLFPKARKYVVTRLPGYSRDGLTALMSFHLGPNDEHSAFGSYLLKKVGGHWEITARWISYYV